MSNEQKNDMSKYKLWGVSLLQWMLILGITGIVVLIVLRLFWG